MRAWGKARRGAPTWRRTKGGHSSGLIRLAPRALNWRAGAAIISNLWQKIEARADALQRVSIAPCWHAAARIA